MPEFIEQYLVWETDLHQSKSSKVLGGVATNVDDAYSIGSAVVRDSFFKPDDSLVVIEVVEGDVIYDNPTQHLATDSDRALDFLMSYEDGMSYSDDGDLYG